MTNTVTKRVTATKARAYYRLTKATRPTLDMDDQNSSFGYWLRRRRKALDLTQAALALRVSCSAAAIKKIEAEERRPSRALAARLADHLALPAHERVAFLDAARSQQTEAGLRIDTSPLAEPPAMPTGEATAPADNQQSPFVGRDKEYGQLLGLLARLTAGNGQLVLIAGEAGIGKSRLMHEMASHARQQGLPVLATHCYEIERAIAYQPVIDLVMQAWQAVPQASLQRIAPRLLAEIAALVPAAASHLFGLPGLPLLSADFPEARQARLFHALLQLFDVLAHGRQLIVLVDDIHWADDASIQFLHFLARQVIPRPMLLICAFRDEELRINPRLAGLVESLRGEAQTRHFALAPLALGDTQALLARLNDPRFSAPDLAGRLHREADGNPFFLWSMLHSLREGAAFDQDAETALLPDALRDSVRVRLARLPPEDRALLDLAAVLGRRFDFETLQELAHTSEAEFLHSMESLVQRRLLREVASGEIGDEGESYDFSHDKIREVVVRDIGMARRVLLHRAVAEMIEQQSPSLEHQRVARLAEHFGRGKVWNKALHYLGLAAGRSQQLFALREALQLLDRAVALQDAHPEVATQAQQLALFQQRGTARAQAGQLAGAVADLQRVIAGARALGQHDHARDVLIQLGMAYRRADAYEEATACLDEALTASQAMHDEWHMADTLYHLGTVAWSNGRNDLAISHHSEAVTICERLGLSDLVAVQAFHGRGEAYFANAEPAAAIDAFSRSLALARGLKDKSYEAENLMMIGWACIGPMGLADFPRALAHFDAALAIASAADLQWHLGPTLIGRAFARAALGRYGEAWADLNEALPRLETLKLVRYQIMAHDALGSLLLDLNLTQRAQQHFERGLKLAGDAGIHYWQPRLYANLALAQLRQGADCDRLALLAALQVTRDRSEVWLMLRCLEALGELAVSDSNTGANGTAEKSLCHTLVMLWRADGNMPQRVFLQPIAPLLASKTVQRTAPTRGATHRKELGTKRQTCTAHADELLALAKSNGLQELIAQALRLRAMAALTTGDCGAARDQFALALRSAEAVGRVRLAWECHIALALIAAHLGDAAAQKNHQTQANALAARIAHSLEGSGLISALAVSGCQSRDACSPVPGNSIDPE